MAGLQANKIDRSSDGPSMLRQFQDDCQALRNFQDTAYAPFATRFAQPSEKTRLQENEGEARVNFQFKGMRNFGAVNLVHGRNEEVRAAEWNRMNHLVSQPEFAGIIRRNDPIIQVKKRISETDFPFLPSPSRTKNRKTVLLKSSADKKESGRPTHKNCGTQMSNDDEETMSPLCLPRFS